MRLRSQALSGYFFAAILLSGGLGVVSCAGSESGDETAAVRESVPTPIPPTFSASTAPFIEETSVPSTGPVTPQASGPIAAGLIEEFIDADFRVVAVVRNDDASFALIVATERSRAVCGSPEQPVRCRIDDTCGATDTAPVCYFFIEPGYRATVDPRTRYVARWPDKPAATSLATDTLRFVDERTIEFIARGQEEGQAIEETWWLDLVTGAAAQLDVSVP